MPNTKTDQMSIEQLLKRKQKLSGWITALFLLWILFPVAGVLMGIPMVIALDRTKKELARRQTATE